MWAGKVMASVFWDSHGVFFIDYLEKGKTINSKRYIGQLMRLKNEIGEKRLQIFTGAGPQRLLPVCRPRKNAPMEEILLQRGSHHRNERLFLAKDKSFYKKGIEKLEKRWTDCVAFEGDYKVRSKINETFSK